MKRAEPEAASEAPGMAPGRPVSVEVSSELLRSRVASWSDGTGGSERSGAVRGGTERIVMSSELLRCRGCTASALVSAPGSTIESVRTAGV